MVNDDIGFVGLAVMGQNLVLNMERNGFSVVVYNRSLDKMRDFLAGSASGKQIAGADDPAALVSRLSRPRKIFVMVKAGQPVDAVIAQVKPHLESGDLIVDAGNSHFKDTQRRTEALTAGGIHFMGIGVSGGEEGALKGPSIMPGGQEEDYRLLEHVLQALAAKVDQQPCVFHVGPGGAGHFVKMVHNGIEYGDMQLIAEAYDFLHRGLGLQAPELERVFDRFNNGSLQSYLIEITASIFAHKDEESSEPLVEKILDQAGQKGTGRWTSEAALELGVPIPTINAAVEARAISSLRSERQQAAEVLCGPADEFAGDVAALTDAVEDALLAAKITSYAQGFALMSAADRAYEYDLDFAEIARIWRGGCIIRARFLNDIMAAYAKKPDLQNLLMAPFFSKELERSVKSLRQVVREAVGRGIPVPAMSASLAYFDSYRSKRLPANLLQAQRDFFGAHTYQRVDREGVFHTEWMKD